MATEARILLPFLLRLTVANKELFKQGPRTLHTEADPLHVRRHVFVQLREVLRVEQLVHLDPPPLSIFLFTATPPPSLNESGRVIVGPQENDNINVADIDTEQHFLTAQIERYLRRSIRDDLLSGRK